MELTAELFTHNFNLSDNDWCSHLKFMITLDYKNLNEETSKAGTVADETKTKSLFQWNQKKTLGETETKSTSYHIITRSTGQYKKSKSVCKERKTQGKWILWKNVTFATMNNGTAVIDKCKSDDLFNRYCTLYSESHSAKSQSCWKFIQDGFSLIVFDSKWIFHLFGLESNDNL